jgi:hypothetical protein
MFALCVYDFPQAEELKVDLYAPDGHQVASKTFPGSGVVDGRTLLYIGLWMPVGSPTGLWSATVHSASASLEKEPFPISTINITTTNTMPKGETDPFETEKKCGFYSRGEEVVIRGINFESISSLPVGIYRLTSDQSDGKYVLRWINTLPAEVKQGAFSISLTIQQSDHADTYYVLPVLNLKEPNYKDFDMQNDCYKVP